MLLKVESILYSIHRSIKEFSTQQEAADSLKLLEALDEKLKTPECDIKLVQPPSTNLNTKGRKSMSGAKTGTKRLKILKEIFEEEEEKKMKKKEKEDKQNEELDKRKRQIEIEERHVALEQKKRKITVVLKDEKGSFINTKNPRSVSPVIKQEPSVYDRYFMSKFSIGLFSTSYSKLTNLQFLVLSITIYKNTKSDVVFKYIDVQPLTAIAAIYIVGADGNCGFRAVSFDVYQNQSKWINVKTDMLKTFLKCKDNLYKAVVSSDTIVQYEEQRMINRLQSTKSPCLNNQDLWFTSYSCPQIVADTYERPVIVYCYVENFLKTGEKNILFESQVYFPLINMELTNLSQPITLLLAFSHFYYVEFARTPKGKLKKFTKPNINYDHQRLREEYKDICGPVDYSVLF